MNDRIVLGLSGTVDYVITWDSAVIEDLVAAYDIRVDELNTAVAVDSERALLVTLLAFLRDGGGGERFIASAAIVEQFAARFTLGIELGGTCTRAGMAMATMGRRSTLHLVSIDDHVRRLLPPEVDYLCSATADSTDPHLIVQYAAGARVRVGGEELVAPYANRIIYANDPPHTTMVLSEDLPLVLSDAVALLISGFNVVQDPAILDARLDQLAGYLDRLDPRCLVHYEDSGFHHPPLATRVNERLGPLVDVHSMNEDELQSYLDRRVDLLDVDDVERALKEIGAVVSAPTVVVHTKYWALAAGPDAQRYAGALDGAIAMAGTRYRYGDGFTAADYATTLVAEPHRAGVAFALAIEARQPEGICCRPAKFLPTATATTIGLGDTFVGGFLYAWVGR